MKLTRVLCGLAAIATPPLARVTPTSAVGFGILGGAPPSSVMTSTNSRVARGWRRTHVRRSRTGSRAGPRVQSRKPVACRRGQRESLAVVTFQYVTWIASSPPTQLGYSRELSHNGVGRQRPDAHFCRQLGSRRDAGRLSRERFCLPLR